MDPTRYTEREEYGRRSRHRSGMIRDRIYRLLRLGPRSTRHIAQTEESTSPLSDGSILARCPDRTFSLASTNEIDSQAYLHSASTPLPIAQDHAGDPSRPPSAQSSPSPMDSTLAAARAPAPKPRRRRPRRQGYLANASPSSQRGTIRLESEIVHWPHVNRHCYKATLYKVHSDDASSGVDPVRAYSELDARVGRIIRTANDPNPPLDEQGRPAQSMDETFVRRAIHTAVNDVKARFPGVVIDATFGSRDVDDSQHVLEPRRPTLPPDRSSLSVPPAMRTGPASTMASISDYLGQGEGDFTPSLRPIRSQENLYSRLQRGLFANDSQTAHSEQTSLTSSRPSLYPMRSFDRTAVVAQVAVRSNSGDWDYSEYRLG